MTSLEIMNLALARIGAQQATSLSDTNKNPRLAIQSYPFARDEVLRYHPWPAITTQAVLQDDADLAWVASTAYAVADFAVSSARLYECITAGTSGTPTGPTTTAADITDGTVHWKYVCAYENLPWKASTAYVLNDRVVNNSRLYKCITAGTSHTSGGPTTTSADITDNTAHWKFCAEYTNLTDYDYQYVLPEDCLRILDVEDSTQFKREGYFLYCDTEYPTVRYVKMSTDPDEWDNFIQTAISLRLAMMICEGVTGSASMAQVLQQEYMQVLVSAMGVAQSEASAEPEHETRWEDA